MKDLKPQVPAYIEHGHIPLRLVCAHRPHEACSHLSLRRPAPAEALINVISLRSFSMFDRRTFAACCTLALPFGPCLAQTTFAPDQYYDNRWYITPFGTY